MKRKLIQKLSLIMALATLYPLTGCNGSVETEDTESLENSSSMENVSVPFTEESSSNSIITNSETVSNIPQENTIIKISNADDLKNIENDPDGSYILTNDIDLNQLSFWTPLCTFNTPFTGVLDGNGYCIKNMCINVFDDGSSEDCKYAGLFRCVSGATIKNLGIEGGSVDINSSISGGTAGAFAGRSMGKVDGEQAILTEVINCYINTTVTCHVQDNGKTSYSATMSIGSFFGSGCANFTNCYNLGEISADSRYADQQAGGFIGTPYTYKDYPITIKSCYNLGKISGSFFSGGRPGAFIGYSMLPIYIDIVDSYYGTDANKYNTLKNAITKHEDNEFTSVKPLKLEEMKTQSNFEGYDFNDTWAILPNKNGGYPYLKCQKSVPQQIE